LASLIGPELPDADQSSPCAFAPIGRRAPADRRFLHDDEAGTLKVLDQALRDDFRDDLVGVVDALAAMKAQREGERCGEVAGVGGR